MIVSRLHLHINKIFIAVMTVLITMVSGTVHGSFHPGIKWKTVQRKNFIIYYPEGHEAFAQRVLSLDREVHDDITGYLGINPRRTPVVLNHDTDIFNGMYAPFPNHIRLYETPAYNLKGFGSSNDDLLDMVFTHEYAHLAHITTKYGLYGRLTSIIGDGLAISNIVSPGWVIEGITTNLETKFSTGGRGRSPLFRSTVLDFAERKELWSMSAAGTESPYGPPGGRIYHS